MALHAFVDRKIAESVKAREQFWKRDLSSEAAYEKSVERNRARLREILGVVDQRLPVRMERFGDNGDTPLVAETELYRVYQVRWPVLEDVFGEGLLLEPVGEAQGPYRGPSPMRIKRRSRSADLHPAWHTGSNSRGVLRKAASRSWSLRSSIAVPDGPGIRRFG